AQALIHRPELLILDEPTDGVDPVGRRDIRNILNSLTGTGVTVFINSHLLSEVEAFCEHVAILKQGQLALEGKISELTASGAYRVQASGVSESALKEIRLHASGVVHRPDALEIQVSSLHGANTIIDLVRSSG